MGAQRLPLFLLLLNIPPQIDRGVDHEHKGSRIEMLIVTFSTNLHSLLITCNRPTTRVVYRCSLTGRGAYVLPCRAEHATRIIVHVYILQDSEVQ